MSTPATGGVIHDIGYRHYDGPRESTARIAGHLFFTGLRNAYGLGRSGRSKVMPVVLGVLALAPAVVMVAMAAVLGLTEPVVGYAGYTSQVQVLVSLFAAAQAPVLFSRDLRSRSIVLHLARPLSSHVFALVRWASMTAACLLFVVVPTTLLWAGALLSGADVSEQTAAWARSLPLALLLAALLAGITGIISSLALRRGLAVVGSILVLVVVHSVVLVVQEVSVEVGNDTAGTLSGLFSPWLLVNGLADAFDAGMDATAAPTGAWVVLYVAVALLVVAGCLAALVARFSQAGHR